MNPNQIINSILNNSKALQNPMMLNAINMYKSNNEQGLKQMAENLCREKGTSIEDVRKRLGV